MRRRSPSRYDASLPPYEEGSLPRCGRLFDVLDPAHAELREAMLDFSLPKQGPAFETWLEHENPLGGRIAPEKLFTFRMGQ